MKQKETDKNKGRVGETQAKAKDEVIINVGLMEYEYGEAKIQRGKSFPVKLSKDMGYDEVRERALKKWEDYDRTFSRDRGYVVTVQDGKLAKQIPGSSEEFTLKNYKEGLGKSYSRIVLYLCPATEKRTESTMPITNWLSEEEAEIERVLWDSDSNVNKCWTECEWKVDIDGLPLKINLNERHILVNEITKYYVIIRCKSMLDQFIQGLSYYGV